MDLKSLKSSAGQYAYQLRKFYPEDETPINHYVCENQVVVLSTKKLYIYYYDKFIDYVGDYLQETECKIVSLSHCTIKIMNKVFNVEFCSEKEMDLFIKYYKKYK